MSITLAQATAALQRIRAMRLDRDQDCCHECKYGPEYDRLWDLIESYERATGTTLA